MHAQTILIMGRSGSGKGTQVRFIEEYIKDKDIDSLPLFHLETGKAFREFIKGSSLASRLAFDKSEKGERQPDFLAVWMWTHTVVLTLEDQMHWIIDGTPRSLPEAKILESAFVFFKRPKPIIIYLNVGSEWSFDRMKARGREDDVNAGSKENRVKWFDEDVVPAIEYFKNQLDCSFFEINGEQEIEKVREDIMAKIKPMLDHK